MSHTDTSKSQARNRTCYHASHRYQQITDNKSYFLPCLTQIPANRRQQIVHLSMPLIETSKSRATNRTSCHASYRYQQITGNKAYIFSCLSQIRQQITGNKSSILPCLSQRLANHGQQIIHLAMPHTDTSKSQATNRASCHASHRYQQIKGNKSYFLPCLKQIPANHRQHIALLAMSHADTSKSQATNRTSCHVSRRYQQFTGNKSYFLPYLIKIPANHRQQIVLLAMSHADTSKSQATNRTSSSLMQIPANHRQQIVLLAMSHTDTSKSQATNRTCYHASHRYQQITDNKSYFLPCLMQIPANRRQQIVHLAMPHTDITKSEATNRAGNKIAFFIIPQIPAKHRQQIVHLAMPRADTSKSLSINSYMLSCLTQIPANHRQQIVHLAMPHTDTSRSQATFRTSFHASHRHRQITANKPYFLPCLVLVALSCPLLFLSVANRIAGSWWLFLAHSYL